MTLEEFLIEARADVDHFETTWRKGAELNPESYPLELPSGEWFDQYQAFTTGDVP